jgi:hypothetical protein
MPKDDHSSTLSPFQRFEKLARALFAIPKKEADAKDGEARRRKTGKKNRRSA